MKGVLCTGCPQSLCHERCMSEGRVLSVSLPWHTHARTQSAVNLSESVTIE